MDGWEVIGRQMTVGQFLAWDGEPGRRYQLIDGEVVMMAPAGTAHGTLVLALGAALRVAARGLRPPLRVQSGAGIHRPERQDRWFEADLAVTAEPAGRGRMAVERPLLIAEVLSPSTEDLDRKVKVPDYCLIPSVMEILLLDQQRAHVECLRRTAAGLWQFLLATGLDATLTLATLPVTLALAELYEGIEVETGVPGAG